MLAGRETRTRGSREAESHPPSQRCHVSASESPAGQSVASSTANKLATATATRDEPPSGLANHEPTTQKTGVDKLLSLPRFDPGHHEGEAAHEGPPQTRRVKPQIQR